MQIPACRLLLVLAGTLASLHGTAVIPGTTTQSIVHYCPKINISLQNRLLLQVSPLLLFG